MPLLAKDSGGGDFSPVPAGMHHAVCYSVLDLGTQPSFNPQYPPKRQVAITWEIPGERITVDGQDLPRAITGLWTLSLATKSKLRPMLESWRGRAFTAEELEGFDLKNLLGVNCFVNVVHKDGKDKQGQARTYANVASVSPLAKGMAKMSAVNPHTFFSFDDKPVKIPATVPEWLVKFIHRSEEWQDLTAPAGHTPRNQPTDDGSAFGSGNAADEEDVPF